MSHRPGARHQRRPSQSHFVLPDDLADPFPAAAATTGIAAAAGVPLPAPPPAKPSSGETKVDEKKPAAPKPKAAVNAKVADKESE